MARRSITAAKSGSSVRVNLAFVVDMFTSGKVHYFLLSGALYRKASFYGAGWHQTCTGRYPRQCLSPCWLSCLHGAKAAPFPASAVGREPLWHLAPLLTLPRISFRAFLGLLCPFLGILRINGGRAVSTDPNQPPAPSLENAPRYRREATITTRASHQCRPLIKRCALSNSSSR